MDEIQFIVAKLNDSPFRKKLSLVDFDDKSPTELLQLLVDVFAVMDEAMGCDVREAEREVLMNKLLTFLNILKYTMPPDEDEREQVIRGLAEGEKHVVYPILHWALQRLPQLSKRAYLAKFLVPEPIPQEFMQDEVLVDLHGDHKALQQSFKEVHKQVDKLRAEPTRPGEIKNEIATLEDERKQLSMKIERLKKNATEGPTAERFAPLLEATSALRQQQDEDGRLGENRRRQLMILSHARQRQEEAGKRLQALNQNQTGNASAEQMLNHLEEEVKDLNQRVNTVMPREMEQETAKLAKLQEELYEPQRSRDDVERLTSEVERMDSHAQGLRAQIEECVGGRMDNKLAMFRQTALVAATKLANKEQELEAVEKALGKAKAEVDDKESALSEVSGSKFMTREEFKAYGTQLREKTHVYKKQKHLLAEARAELVRLGRTEQILRGRDRHLDQFLTQLEAKRGVAGYRDLKSKLESASEAASGVDSSKEQALGEIASMVQRMTDALTERKNVLAPQIKLLREVRKEYQQVEGEYGRKKQTYDKVAVGLEVERQSIEQDAEQAQEEALKEESNYHYFVNLTEISQASLQRVTNEEKWAKGDGHLLPNFRTYADLYRDKESRQKALKEQLQVQKRSIEGNEGTAKEQRKLFADLAKLLNAKIRSKSAAIDDHQLGGSLGNDSSAMDASGGIMRLS
mmetsp:Transcript_53157/g.106618  ORF Transcript_53157/g.106618 Transcript_53157/m.106618 type:complete len:689 (+) Transcript_53157:86-2152(+)